MPAAIPFEQDLLQLLFWGTAITAGSVNIAQNHITTPATQYYVSLLRQDPSAAVAPDQTTGEVAYTGYARQPVARSNLGWSVVGGVVMPLPVLQFGVASAVSTQILATHFAVGTALTLAGKLLAWGKLLPPIAIVTGVNPRIDANPAASRFPDDWL
jgi:hypothetical protein